MRKRVRAAEQVNQAAAPASSPYATGGGGVTLEHVFGATLLAALLTGDSVPGLGDEQSVVKLKFQARTTSPVDDVVIYGEPRGSNAGEPRRLAVGVRRRPKIAASDKKFVALVANCLKSIEASPTDFDADGQRLALVVAGRQPGAEELRKLAEFARTQPSDSAFRAAVEAAGATTAKVRARLRQFDKVVGLANGSDATEATWQLLRSLHVLEAFLEQGDTRDRTHCVSRLRSVCDEASDADRLFALLVEQAAKYDAAGAEVDEAMLRRDLTGRVRIGRSPSFRQAARVLRRLNEQVADRTRSELVVARPDGIEERIALSRDGVRDRLVEAIERAARSTRVLVVTGDPDVGKSSLAMAAVALLRERGASVAAMSLRDVQERVVDLEAALGSTIEEALGGSAVGTARVLVVDGAESVLAGREDVFRALSGAGVRAGFVVVAVTRTDGSARVLEVLRGVVAPAVASTRVEEFEVPGLDEKEVEDLSRRLPTLSRFSSNDRAKWLLRRLGLVDAILRGNAAAALPSGPLCEADVFAAVWARRVRRGEEVRPGDATPDGREAVLVGMARAELVGSPPEFTAIDPHAPPSLRRDGLLASFREPSAWRDGDEFAGDLVRDFAVARLLLKSSWEPLLKAGAPRWSLRAVRLCCQAMLLRDPLNTEAARSALQRQFDEIASRHGDRWSEIPWEAVLTSRAPATHLEEAWPVLSQERGVELDRLLKLVEHRFVRGSLADADIVAPVVQLLCDHANDVAKLDYEVRERCDTVVLAWLRTLSARARNDAPNALRQRVRKLVVARCEARDTHELIEAVALLGPDLDERAMALLRGLAESRPSFVYPCVETFYAPLSMAAHQPDLLIELADAYYIERPDPKEQIYGSGYPLDDGVRSHRGHPFGHQMASWMHGPFWPLLNATPKALALINKILDHAAAVRVRTLQRFEQSPPDAELTGLTLDLPGLGRRLYVGDSHVWSWYRGSGVGPEVCTSALLAVERFADHFVAVGASVRSVAARLLVDCNNLAIPGLVVGLLVRHISKVKDGLDPWLSVPEVWHLEFGRAISEGQLHVQGPDAPDVHGKASRRVTFREVAAYLVSHAIAAKDQARLDRLHQVGDELIANARAQLKAGGKEGAEAEDYLVTVRGWASALQHENYKPTALDDGREGLQFEVPEDIATGLAPDNERHNRFTEGLGLLNRHAIRGRTGVDLAQLLKDVAVARALIADPPSDDRMTIVDAPAATAAAVLESAATGSTLPPDVVLWAAELLVAVALAHRDTDPMGHGISKFEMGADRSAARGVPLLLLPFFNEVAKSAPSGEQAWRQAGVAFERLITSTVIEVRRASASALSALWRAPCGPPAWGGTACRHAAGLDGARGAARMCSIGPFDYDQQRRPEVRLGDPLPDAIRRVKAGDSLLARLTAPIVACSACVQSNACAVGDAADLLAALIDLHRRGTAHYSEGSYYSDDDDRRSVVEALLALWGFDGREDLLDHVVFLIDHAHAFDRLLDDLAYVATYDSGLRSLLRRIWPTIMDRVFGANSVAKRLRADRYWSDSAVAALIPIPMLSVVERDADRVVAAALSDWPTLDELSSRIEHWIPLAVGSSKGVDVLVAFLSGSPLIEQARRGLPWVLRLVDGHFEGLGATARLPTWLRRLRDGGVLDGTGRRLYERIVDGLAKHGDYRAIELQRLDE